MKASVKRIWLRREKSQQQQQLIVVVGQNVVVTWSARYTLKKRLAAYNRAIEHYSVELYYFVKAESITQKLGRDFETGHEDE